MENNEIFIDYLGRKVGNKGTILNHFNKPLSGDTIRCKVGNKFSTKRRSTFVKEAFESNGLIDSLLIPTTRKVFIITEPNGSVVKTTNLKKYAKENNLGYDTLYATYFRKHTNRAGYSVKEGK